MQESKKISVKTLGVAGVVAVDVLPYYTAQAVLRKCSAEEDMFLTTAPFTGCVFPADAELWGKVEAGQTLYAVPRKYPRERQRRVVAQLGTLNPQHEGAMG